MSRVHSLPRGAHIAPMPAKVFGSEGARLPGGLPPEPNRTPWRRAGDTGTFARVMSDCREIKREVFGDKKEWHLATFAVDA